MSLSQVGQEFRVAAHPPTSPEASGKICLPGAFETAKALPVLSDLTHTRSLVPSSAPGYSCTHTTVSPDIRAQHCRPADGASQANAWVGVGVVVGALVGVQVCVESGRAG